MRNVRSNAASNQLGQPDPTLGAVDKMTVARWVCGRGQVRGCRRTEVERVDLYRIGGAWLPSARYEWFDGNRPSTPKGATYVRCHVAHAANRRPAAASPTATADIAETALA